LPNSTRGRFLCEHSLADGSRGLRLPLAAAGPLLASLAACGRTNLPRVFITLNHKLSQKPNTSSITCPIQPTGGFCVSASWRTVAVLSAYLSLLLVLFWHPCIWWASEPPAGFYHAQSQIVSETQYIINFLPNSTRGRFLCEHSLAYGSRGLRLPLTAALILFWHPWLVVGVRTSRGFLSHLITKHSRSLIPHTLLAQFNPREVFV